MGAFKGLATWFALVALLCVLPGASSQGSSALAFGDEGVLVHNGSEETELVNLEFGHFLGRWRCSDCGRC